MLLFAALEPACARSPVERGSFPVNSIMACGSYHTPRDREPVAPPGLADIIAYPRTVPRR